MRKKLALMAAVTALFFCACKSINPAKDPVTLNGMIYDTQNRPVVNYTIYIDGEYKCQSDISGRFILKDVAKGIHFITGEGDSYLNINEEVVIYDKAQILYVRVPSVSAKLKEAYTYLEQGLFEKAEESIGEILSCDDGNTDAILFMSVIKLRQDKKDESLGYLERLKKKKEGSKYVTELEKLILEN